MPRRKARKAATKPLRNKKSKSLLKSAVTDVVRSSKFKNILKSGARWLKGRIDSSVDAVCPECKSAAKWALNLPTVQKVLKKGEASIKKKCPTCGEVLDIVVKA